MNVRSLLLLVCSAGMLAGVLDSQGGALGAAEAEVIAVQVSRPVTREVADYVDFTGRTQAVNSVNVIPRVSGYVVKAPFREGSMVKQGDLLFEIDPRPYRAQGDVATAQVDVCRAQIKLAQATLARDEQNSRATPGVVSAQQLDQDRAAVDIAEAQLKAAQALLEVAKLNLDFCRVTSPIDGVVSREHLTPGNLAVQEQTMLTTVVSLDPMYAYFDVDEPTLMRLRRTIGAEQLGHAGRAGNSLDKVPMLMGLQGEDGFPHKGVVNFINNQVNPTADSVVVRGVFPNPSLPNGNRLLMPGMFVRMRLPMGQPHQALLISDRAINSDQGKKYVYTVNVQGRIEVRHVETGPLQSDGLRVIESGLNADDRVVVSELKQLRPGATVKADEAPMR